MQETFTLKQAMAELGISRNTLKRWLGICGIEPTGYADDSRFQMITAEQVSLIRERLIARGQYLTPPTPALSSPPQTIQLPSPSIASSDLPHRPSQGHSGASTSRKLSDKPHLPEGWISFQDAWEMTGIKGNWDKSQVDKTRWATPGPFLRNRSTIMWALSPEQQEAFFAHFGRRG